MRTYKFENGMFRTVIKERGWVFDASTYEESTFLALSAVFQEKPI